MNEKLPVAACEVRAVRGVFLFFGFWESAGAGRAVSVWAVRFSCRCRSGQCGFRASVGAVFILNGMIFSFLDEKRVFEGVV